MSNLNFQILNIPIPETIKQYPIEKQEEIFNYLNELDEYEKKAYEIAYNHLGSSFDIYRSNGFKEWKQNKKH
jgi:hypothetical protein